MSRQYFEDLIIDPPTANIVPTVSTAETILWNVAQFSPIHAFDGYKGVGKVYKLMAGGIYTTSTVAPTLILTPRFGVSVAAGVSLGASVTQTLPASLTNEAWFMQAILVVRAIGAPGTNSAVVLTGQWQGGGAAATAGSGPQLTFGGTPSTAVDLSVETGICMGATWNTTATNAMTIHWVTMQSLN